MKNAFIIFLHCLLASACSHMPEEPSPDITPVRHVTALEIDQAESLAQLPLNCLETEFPNRLGQSLGDTSDLKRPSDLHPSFYGCFDWHSSVHGYWSLVSLLKEFPEIKQAEEIEGLLRKNLNAENIKRECDYLEGPHNKLFERTYGWSWLMKLSLELHEWESPLGDSLSKHLAPLTQLLANRYLEFLPKLNYPIRVGTHGNTAFGLKFAYDYALATQNDSLQKCIADRAKFFFLNDQKGPLQWEPDGYDFLSPCLEELDLMRRILTPEEFNSWLDEFLPQIKSKDFRMEPGIVSDRTDGLLVHLDGLNFSRACCLYALANQDPKYAHLEKLADEHLQYSLKGLHDGNYEGGHWLGSFALLSLQLANKSHQP